MKELSVEEKAKAYDEVREKIAIRFGSNVADEIFSQFEMSEDEKIRNWLISTLKSLNSTAVQIDGAYEMMLPAIAWLEKQGQVKESLISQQVNKTCKENDNSLTGENERIKTLYLMNSLALELQIKKVLFDIMN